MKTRKNKNGISLIVLVITIIVMIILAAAIIISISNSGIINRANSAVEETNEKQMKELVSLAWAEAYLKDTTEVKDDAYFYKEVIAYLKANGITDEELAKYDITADKNGADANLKTAVLNEYGFYYDELYLGTVTIENEGYEIGYVFHSNGNVDYYASGELVNFEFGIENLDDTLICTGSTDIANEDTEYSNKQVTITSYNEDGTTLTTAFTFSQEGKTVTVTDGDEVTTAKLIAENFHGIYYNRVYSTSFEFDGVQVSGRMSVDNNKKLTYNYTIYTTTSEGTASLTKETANGQILIFNDGEDRMVYISTDGEAVMLNGLPFTLTDEIVEGSDTSPENEIAHNGTIPEGGTYYVGVTATDIGDYTGATATYTAGQAFPSTVNTGDVYVYNNYEYRYNQAWFLVWDDLEDFGDLLSVSEGWGVMIIDRKQTTYGEVLGIINNKPLTSMIGTFAYSSITTTEGINIPSTVENVAGLFQDCSQLVDASSLVIPASVKAAENMFNDCTSLTSLPDFTNATNVTNMSNMFYNCSALVETPDLSNCINVTNMSEMFYNCILLTTAPDISNFAKLTNISRMFESCDKLVNGPTMIPAGVTAMSHAFRNCSKMTTTPNLSNCVNLTDISGAFYNCESITKLPNLNNCTKVTDMSVAFAYCKAATSYLGSTDSEGDFSNYVIPASVTSLNCTFLNCINMTKAPNVSNCTVLEDMHSTFKDCTNLVTGPTTIPSSVNTMFCTFENCTSLTGTITINSSPTNYNSCFNGTVKPIKIAGACSSTAKANLAGTAKNGNVTY